MNGNMESHDILQVNYSAINKEQTAISSIYAVMRSAQHPWLLL